MSSALNKVIEEFEKLPLEDKEYSEEIFHKIIVEERRAEIKGNALQAKLDSKAGKLKSFTDVKEMTKHLNEN